MRTIITCKYWVRLSLVPAIEIQVYNLPLTNSNELNRDLRPNEQLLALMVEV